jgi:hypothetical protein
MLDQTFGAAVGKNERVILLIQESIRLGIVTGPAILTALRQLGFDRRHAGIHLSKLRGSNPERHIWTQDGAGTYHLLEQEDLT